ncbi:hypothetical protein SUDANB95_05489 [Actinosynnema sp. ALI-1.44]
MAHAPDRLERHRYDPRSYDSDAPVDPPVARTAALRVARQARDDAWSHEELRAVLALLGIDRLARQTKTTTRKARRR